MKLVAPSAALLPSYLEAFEEYQQNQVTTYHFLDAQKTNVLDHIRRYQEGDQLPENHVPATYLWLVDDDQFIAEVCIRHALTDALLRFGGHIGYGVRCRRWNQGVGTRLLSMTLAYVRKHFPFDKVLITCNDDNTGSAKVIEKNGGVLQDKIENVVDGRTILTRRYWIDLNPLYSRCGMRCDQCLIYRPNVEKDDRRPAICAAWAKIWPGFEADASTIICDGCLCEAEDARLFSPECEARRCVRERRLPHCGCCSQYPCAIFPAEPSHEEVMQKIEGEKRWTWDDEKLMEAYSCRRNMDLFRAQNGLGQKEQA